MSSKPPLQPLLLLRPMEILEILDESFDLYKRNFRLFFGIALLLNAPVSLLQGAIGASSGTALSLALLASVVTLAALTRAALDRILGQRTTIAAAYRHALRRLFRVLFGLIAYLLAIMIGLILLVIPGLVIGLWWMLFLPVIMGENRGWFEMLRRPVDLTGNHLWRLFFVALGVGFIGIIIASVLFGLEGLVEGVAGIDPNHPDFSNGVGMAIFAAYLLAGALIQSAWAPVVTTVQTLVYVDLRIRREAFDLELLTSGVEARLAAERAPAPTGTPAPGQVAG
jgi:hypothetical protein